MESGVAAPSPEFQRLERDFGWRIQDHAAAQDGIWSVAGAAKLSYPEEGNAICAAVEDRSFWFRARNRAILDLLEHSGRPAALWEIGSGNGFVAQALQQAGMNVVAVEPGPFGARTAAQRGVFSVCGLLEDMKLPENSIPALGCFDVLEHLEHPERMLREFQRILVSGGKLAVTVPALQGLWSQADDLAGHFRRYSRRSLDELLSGAGFQRLSSGYMMASMVPPLYFFRALPYRRGKRYSKAELEEQLQRQLAPGSAAMAISAALLWLERCWRRLLPLPCGTSVIGLYAKQN